MTEMPDCIGPYRIVSKVGEGDGRGVQSGRFTPRASCGAQDHSRVRRGLLSTPAFWQEARAAGAGCASERLPHLDVAEEQDRLVLVMEFIEGESLARRVERGALPAREAAQIVLAILSALEAFHKIGIVHRD